MLDKILGARQTPAPEPAQSYFMPVKSTAGIHMDEETALTYSAVFSAVKVISETGAMLPWRVYQEAPERRDLLAESQLDQVLHRRPNPDMTAFQFREFLLSCALLWGNGYAEIERTRAQEIANLWPIHPRNVTLDRNDRDQLVYRVRADDGTENVIPSRQMYHLRGPTKDGISGRSMISIARESWGLGIAAEQFAAGFFGNGGTPSLVIQQGDGSPDLSPEGAQNMLESFDRRHKGTKNAGKTAYLERGFTVEKVGVPQKDAQFIEGRKFQTSEVARWFRLPPHKIGDMEAATFSNIEQQSIDFVTDAILPWTERLEQEANAKLTDQPGVITKIQVNGLLRGDSAARSDFYTKMRDLGAMSINEIRALEDMNPIPNGDLRLVPLNMVSVDRASQAGATDPASAVRGVVVDAHERMIGKEQRAIERAHKKGQPLNEWAQQFYHVNEPQFLDILRPGVLGIAEMYGMDSEVCEGSLRAHVREHVESSKRDAVSEKWTHWPDRAAPQADRLIGRLIGASNA